MTLYRNVYPLYWDMAQVEPHHIVSEAIGQLLQRELVQAGDLVIITRGDHAGVHGGTNTLKIVKAGQ